jgi:hypothetical protein
MKSAGRLRVAVRVAMVVAIAFAAQAVKAKPDCTECITCIINDMPTHCCEHWLQVGAESCFATPDSCTENWPRRACY